MRSILNISIFLFFIWFGNAQMKAQMPQDQLYSVSAENNPKLLIGIVVDQMRYDYLTRFYNQFGEAGFKRMVNEGFSYKNMHYNYVPTYTGPGHASIYTGTTPKVHGIISNSWYDKESKKIVYCAGDDNVQSVGTPTVAGQMSPHRMKTTTFADENRLSTQMRGKTIGISLKDRGAILPAGGSANAAYWFQGLTEGNFISSTYYMNTLPKWVKQFNDAEIAESYFKIWMPYKDIKTYQESGTDDNQFETGFIDQKTATFPYDLNALKEKNGHFEILKVSPFGNSLVTDFALAAIEGEDLGKDQYTDVLTISYSSTDYIGHNFGVNSKEVEDTYIRLDKEIERLLNALDTKFGKGTYTVFLTSDHGAINVPKYLESVKIPAGYFDARAFWQHLNVFMQKKYGATDLIENVSNHQIFLNRGKIDSMGLDLLNVQQQLVNEIITYKNIDKAFTAHAMQEMAFTEGVEHLLQNGYNQKRSGDVITVLDPAYISYGITGSTHGSSFSYDTHVPLLFFGKGIKKGHAYRKTNIVDIAPTVSALLGISFPNGNTGEILIEVLEN